MTGFDLDKWEVAAKNRLVASLNEIRNEMAFKDARLKAQEQTIAALRIKVAQLEKEKSEESSSSR